MHTEDRLIGDATAIFLRAGIFSAGMIAIATHPFQSVYKLWFPLTIAGALVYLFLSSLALFSLARNPKDTHNSIALVCLDVLMISAVIWAMPAHNSLYAMLYYIPVLYAASRLEYRSCITAAALSALAYLFVSLSKDAIAQDFFDVSAFALSALILAAILGMLYSQLFSRRRLAEALSVSLKRLSAAYDVARAAWDESYSFEQIISRVLQEINSLSHARDCFIALLDKDGNLQLTKWENADDCFNADAAWKTLKGENNRTPLIENTSTGESCLTLPLQSTQTTLGVVQIHRSSPFLRRETEILHALCVEVSVALENAMLRRELVKLATTDSLTGLCTRAEISCRIATEVSRAAHHGHPLSLLMIDVDGFKAINDHKGHAAGDCILKRLSEVFENELRPCDSAGRWGGDEFCLLLPETTLEGSLAVAERLRRNFSAAIGDCGCLREEKCGHIHPELADTTLSIGVISSRDAAINSEQLLAFADRALYAAKRAGRNTVRAFVVGADSMPPPEGHDHPQPDCPQCHQQQGACILNRACTLDKSRVSNQRLKTLTVKAPPK